MAEHFSKHLFKGLKKIIYNYKLRDVKNIAKILSGPQQSWYQAESRDLISAEFFFDTHVHFVIVGQIETEKYDFQSTLDLSCQKFDILLERKFYTDHLYRL